MIALFRWVFLGGAIVAAVVLIFLSAQTMKTKLNWQKKLRGYEQEVAKLDGEVKTLKVGVPANRTRVFAPEAPDLNPVADTAAPEIGLRLVSDAANWWGRQQGRRWVGTPTKFDPATGAATVTIEEPRPHDIGDKSFLYIFDAREIAVGGKYLGEFRVVAVTKDDNTNSIDVVPADPLSPAEIDNLTKSSGTGMVWHIFDKLPVDRYTTFAHSEEAINTLLPATVRPEYLRHGQDKADGDPDERVVNGKYHRPLYDFMALFREYRAQRPILTDRLLARTNDAASLLGALNLLIDPTTGRVAERNKEVIRLEEDLVKAKADSDMVAAEHKKLEDEVAAVRAQSVELVQKNKALALEIANVERASLARITSATAIAAPQPVTAGPR